MPQRDRLDQNISQRGRLDRPGEHRAAEQVCGQAAQELGLGAAADDVNDVDVPAAHVVAALSGVRLQEFRQLAQDVDSSATRAHDRAKRDLANYPERGPQFLGELSYFAAQSRDLETRASAAQVDPQQIGPIVDRLLEEARQADRRMRDARVFTSVWDDSGRTITILYRMASLVRS